MKERERQVNCGKKDIIITEPMSIQFHASKGRGECAGKIYRKFHLSTFPQNWRDRSGALCSVIRIYSKREKVSGN